MSSEREATNLNEDKLAALRAKLLVTFLISLLDCLIPRRPHFICTGPLLGLDKFYHTISYSTIFFFLGE